MYFFLMFPNVGQIQIKWNSSSISVESQQMQYRWFLRVSAHPLRIQTGRYAQNNIPRNERYCLCCNDLDLEDEYHFICICRCYSDLRKKFISRIYYENPSVYKFHKLLVSCDKSVIYNVCKYIKEALVIRNTILNNTVP